MTYFPGNLPLTNCEALAERIRQASAEIDAALTMFELHDEAGDVEPWERPADWWKGEPDAL